MKSISIQVNLLCMPSTLDQIIKSVELSYLVSPQFILVSCLAMCESVSPLSRIYNSLPMLINTHFLGIILVALTIGFALI